MDSRSPRHLRQSGDRVLDFVAGHHHQVGQLVNDDHYVWQRRIVFPVLQIVFNNQIVVTVDVAHAGTGKQFISSFHFRNDFMERLRRLAWIRDNRRKQVGNPVIDVQFHHFRIDHHHLHFVRFGFHQDARDDAVDADGFPAAGRTCNQQMGHFRQIRALHNARDVPS